MSANIRQPGRLLPYSSGDRCQRCGSKSFNIGRQLAECGKCSWPVPLQAAARGSYRRPRDRARTTTRKEAAHA